MNYDAYAKAANRGDFQYEVLDYDEFGGVYEEQCTYKGKYIGATIRQCEDGWTVNIDELQNKPFYIVDEIRKSKRSARELLERIVRNDRENNGKGNEKYIRT